MQQFSEINIHNIFSKAERMPLDKESISFQEIPLFERHDSRCRVNTSNPGASLPGSHNPFLLRFQDSRSGIVSTTTQQPGTSKSSCVHSQDQQCQWQCRQSRSAQEPHPCHLPVTGQDFGDPGPHNYINHTDQRESAQWTFEAERYCQIQKENNLAEAWSQETPPTLHYLGFLALVCVTHMAHKRCLYKPQQRNFPYRKGQRLRTVHSTVLLPLGEDLKNTEARCIHRALLHCLKALGTTPGRCSDHTPPPGVCREG